MKCLYVYNPTSGRQNNEKKRDYILSALSTKFDVVDCKPTQKKGDAGIFAREACGSYDVLVVSGGDGTIHEVINAMAKMQNRPTLGYIPTGTTNDLAHSLKIPKNIKKAVKIILNGKSVSHDIFRANDAYGIYVCCFGVFTKSSYKTSQKEKKKFGRLAYFKYGIGEMFKSKPVHLKLEYDGQTIEDDFALCIIANSRYVAGYKINSEACWDDGTVDVLLIKNRQKRVKLLTFLRIFKMFLFGKNSLIKDKNATILQLDKFKMTLPKDEIINLDGENGFKGSFEFEVLKRHLEIFVK